MACPDPDRLQQVATGVAPAEVRGAVLDHAAGCAECHAALEALRSSSLATASTQHRDAAAAAPPSRLLESGEQVDRYRLGRVLGRGAMGVVYAAHDHELAREVAVKVLRPSASAERLRREAQALARLAHPNVVRVYDVGEHDGHAFVAMELVSGTNLRQWLSRERTLEEILDVLTRAGRGLAAAHRAGLVHRDVKPDNILCADDGGVLVGDFGLATEAGTASQEGAAPTVAAAPLSSESLTATGAAVGTPAYMAPEQVVGEASAAADQYGFCVTAWEALYGARPIQGTTLWELRTNARDGAIVMPESHRPIPARIERALRRGLSPNPEERFPSMDALLLALVAPPSRRRWWLLGAAVAAVAITIAIMAGVRQRTSGGIGCDATAVAIAGAWNPGRASSFDAMLVSSFDRFTDRWRRQRVEVCRATHQRHVQALATHDRQVACLDRARLEFAALVDGVAADVDEFDVLKVLRAMPTLDRCVGDPTMPAAPRAEVASRVASLDRVISEFERGALWRSPRATSMDLAELRRQVEAVGYRPQVLRVRLLEGTTAELAGDNATAASVYRDVMVLAEADADDLTRSRAGAYLALLQARASDPDARASVAAARAALTRAGGDHSIERSLVTAERVIAAAASDHAAAIAAAQRLVALAVEDHGEDSPLTTEDLSTLAAAYTMAGDLEAARATVDRMRPHVEALAKAAGTDVAAAPILTADPNLRTMAGDFAGAMALGKQQHAIWRSMPVRLRDGMALAAAAVALAAELDGNCAEAVVWYAESESVWASTDPAFDGTGVPYDPRTAAVGVVDGLVGQVDCLVRMGKTERALAVARRALEQAVAGTAYTAEQLPMATRALARAHFAIGAHAQVVERLSPMLLAPEFAALRPFPRAEVRFLLAQSLWEAGGPRDRQRAISLAIDASAEYEQARAMLAPQPAMVRMARRAADRRREVTTWLTRHAP